MAKKIKAVYMGKRAWGAQKLVCSFRLENGRELLFKGITGCYIGGTYLIDLTGKDTYQCPKRPDRVFDAPEPDEKLVKEWEIQEITALGLQRERKLTAKFRSNKKFLADFENLEKLVGHMSGAERRIFVDFLVEELSTRAMNRRIADMGPAVHRLRKKLQKKMKGKL